MARPEEPSAMKEMTYASAYAMLLSALGGDEKLAEKFAHSWTDEGETDPLKLVTKALNNTRDWDD
ncbi:MAG TPA: hypothetical protein VLH19_00340 [Patescibacteria group bacterium]|nr:hypothetical protein [Patescibacteria group bacterium]